MCLTLTSGGCNSLHLCINGANKVCVGWGWGGGGWGGAVFVVVGGGGGGGGGRPDAGGFGKLPPARPPPMRAQHTCNAHAWLCPSTNVHARAAQALSHHAAPADAAFPSFVHSLPPSPQTLRQVFSVDCNPAQSALLELKRVAIRQLGYEDVWALFGEGRVSCLLPPAAADTAGRHRRRRCHSNPPSPCDLIPDLPACAAPPRAALMFGARPLQGPAPTPPRPTSLPPCSTRMCGTDAATRTRA